MSTSEIFLIAMTIILTVPYLVWRLGRTEYYAPLVVVQIEIFTATLLMALASTMLSVPLAAPKLEKLKAVIAKSS